MYDIKCNKISVYLRMYCQPIFRGDVIKHKFTFANAKLVLMRIKTDSIKRGPSDN